MNGRQPTPKQRRFIKALLAHPESDHVAAARAAGYATPGEVGFRLLKRLAPWIEEERGKASRINSMGPEEIIKGLEQIAQDVEHRDRFNALKMLATIHKLDDPEKSTAGKADVELSETIETLRGTVPAALQASKPDSKRRLSRVQGEPDS